ncbi:SRPBCC family protein [Pelagicoccus sp. SDUM812002]|uniref:SRPBCC family protein n=1 Tax=Pelagicoccus sp. SDUM812002 TaxID=3041266 RepID=UPI00280E9138|nr:SRPBCC family protein [Pelagicoccus sp. SDUM812002]MDQ8185572.1 SRPBCC family protein [Pelagicoccus sp. SDUM812002]
MPKFSLERSIMIRATAAAVFANVKDFQNWAGWSPWILAEPMCKLDYSEDGRGYSWSGDIIGSGKMEVMDTVENRELHYRLTFLKPFKSVSSVSFFFDECSEETNTRWTMSGDLPFFLFWMKKMTVAAISMDYDRGLRMLKDKIELGWVPSLMKFAGFEMIDGFEYVGLSNDCRIPEISVRLGEDMQKATALAKESGLKISGPPVCFYDTFEVSKGTASYTVALPVEAGSPCPTGLISGTMPDQKCYAIHHTGPYRHLGNPWAAGTMHQRAKLFAQNKSTSPFEIYLSDPANVAEEELSTSVCFPAK